MLTQPLENRAASIDHHAGDSSSSSSSSDDDPGGHCCFIERTTPITIEVEYPSELADFAPAGWIALLQRAAERLGLNAGSVSLRIVGADEMSRLHERHFGMAGPTDVISFDHLEHAPDRSPNQIDADIAICHDVARDEAAKRGHDLGRELLLYALHGMLHCLGYDDLTDEGFEAMHRKEDETLDAIGVGATFGSAADAGSAFDASVRDPQD